MNRIRTATIFGTVSLVMYFFVVGVAVVFAGRSEVPLALTTPLSLLQGLFSESFGNLDLTRNLPAVCSLWLAFICMVDLSMIFSSLTVKDFVHAYSTADRYSKRLLIGLHVLEAKRPAGL